MQYVPGDRKRPEETPTTFVPGQRFVPGQHAKARSWGTDEPYVSPIPPHPDDDWRFNSAVARPKGAPDPAFWRDRGRPPR